MFTVKNGKINGLKIISPDAFEDYRGFYIETFNEEIFDEILPGVKFKCDDISISRKDVLRGLHGNYTTGKLISVHNGEIYAIFADNRPESSTYKQWESHIISAQNHLLVYLPPGIGNSMLALTDNVVYFYKQTEKYVPNSQFTIKWNDPEWNFWWPIKDPILSQRDAVGGYVETK